MIEEILWEQKYRPTKVQDIILPKTIKDLLQSYVDSGNISNILLTGSYGLGKTTAAEAMLKELDSDYIKINGSHERNMDMLENKLINFAATVSMNGGRKYVLIDEADGLNHVVQPALRGIIEKYSKTCGFIFTANEPDKIMKAISDSRMTQIHFVIKKEEKQSLQIQFFKRVISILDQEKIVYDKKAVASIIQKYFPDMRRTFIELQNAYIKDGEITSLVFSEDVLFSHLFENIKNKDFNETRKWLGENVDIDFDRVIRGLYEEGKTKLTDNGNIILIRTLGAYQPQLVIVPDKQLQLMALAFELFSALEGEYV